MARKRMALAGYRLADLLNALYVKEPAPEKSPPR